MARAMTRGTGLWQTGLWSGEPGGGGGGGGGGGNSVVARGMGQGNTES